MFASFIVSLRPAAQAPIGNSTGKSLHGLFFNMLEQQDATLASRLHEDNAARPLTVSPLRGRIKYEGDQRIVTPDQMYWVRYTTLSDELFNALSKILLGKFLYRDCVKLDGAEFKVEDVAVEPERSRGWARLSSAEELWNRADTTTDIALRFASPTTFRQRGLSLQFPIPANVFHSYRERWNAFTHLPIDDGLIPWVEENVAVEAHHLQTRRMWYSDYELHGFIGWVRFTAKKQDAIRLKQLNALADFAFFSGTGHKTTQGMGQTRRIQYEPNNSERTEAGEKKNV